MDENKEVVVEQTQETKVEVEETDTKEVETKVEEQMDEDVALLEEDNSEEEELTEEEKEAHSSDVPLVELLKRADVKDFLKKVRQQEKNKLYEVMKKKDAKIEELTQTVATLENTIKTYKEGNDTTIADLKLEVDALKEKVSVAEKAKAEKDLELYRTKAIQAVRDSGSDLVDELVVGNTEEEIDSSIERAKAKFEEIYAKATSKKETKPVPKPVAPVQDTGARKLTMEEIANMSPQEYAKHREQIKKGIH